MIPSSAPIRLLLVVCLSVTLSGCCRKPPPTVADCDAQYAAIGHPPPMPPAGVTEAAAKQELFEWMQRCAIAEDTCRLVGKTERADELVARCEESRAAGAKLKERFEKERAR